MLRNHLVQKKKSTPTSLRNTSDFIKEENNFRLYVLIINPRKIHLYKTDHELILTIQDPIINQMLSIKLHFITIDQTFSKIFYHTLHQNNKPRPNFNYPYNSNNNKNSYRFQCLIHVQSRPIQRTYLTN